METLPKLQEGDLIYITAPAKAIEKQYVDDAIQFFQQNGFRVLVSEHCLGNFHYFSGTDAERAADFQFGLNHPEVKAIVCARGGYGCVRILDHIQWAGQVREPKWIVGFSDVTVLHQRMLNFGIETLHATMPLNFSSNSELALTTLINALTRSPYLITIKSNSSNQIGKTRAKLVGGNLSILYSLLGTDDQIDYSNTILFIEDLAEQIYHLDRMFFAFHKAGILDKIKGLIVGGITDMKDTAVPFGQSVNEVILSHFTYRNIPIAFDFPAGHIDDNRALILGREVDFEVSTEKVRVSFN